jgi:hypothetical protein
LETDLGFVPRRRAYVRFKLFDLNNFGPLDFARSCLHRKAGLYGMQGSRGQGFERAVRRPFP